MERIDKVVAPLKSRLQKQTDPERELNRILDHPSLRSFRQQHPEYPRETYRRSLPQLRQMVTERKHCDRCPGLDQCPNLVPGYRPELHGFGGYLDLRLAPCEKQIARDKEHHRKQLIRSHYIPSDIIQATFDQIQLDAGRVDAIEAAIDFCRKFESKKPSKGLYLYGPFGVGKSRIAGAMAQYLVHYNVDSLMVYVPDFVREIKESIRDGQIQRKLDTLRQATVLIMDDVGAENITPWIRDEIFGAILQYRMVEKLPTVYTSNLGLDELEDHLARSDKGGIEKTKAKRIMERIRPYVEVCYVDGPNRRQT